MPRFRAERLRSAAVNSNFGVHFIANVNDGLYGNTHSWIPDFAAHPDPAPFIGIRFGHKIDLRSLAWGRDNGDVAGDCCGGTLTDRALGLYTIQVTTAVEPGHFHTRSMRSLSGKRLGHHRHYRLSSANHPTYFNSYLRHRFDLSATSGDHSGHWHQDQECRTTTATSMRSR